MPLETANYIYDLVQANPPDTDLVQQGDDHLRLLKKVIQQTWPNITGPNLPTSTGTANAQIVTHVYGPAAYSSGQLVIFKAGFTNTGATTINVNGAGVANIVRGAGGSALTGGEIVAGVATMLMYDAAIPGFYPIAGNGTFLPLWGGTLTGNLTVAPTSGGAFLTLNKPASGVADGINASMAGSLRWQMTFANNTPESGSNVGSDFQLSRYADAGTLIDTPLTITRASGQPTFTQIVNIAPATVANASLNLNKPAGAVANQIYGMTAGSPRWIIQPGNSAAESGSNVGSDLTIQRYSDAGAYIDNPLTITRSTGQATLNQPLNIICASTGANIILSKAASSNNCQIVAQTAGATRWALLVNAAGTESGGNVGADFVLTRYSDAQAAIDNPLTITRASALATFTGQISLSGTPANNSRVLIGTTSGSTRWQLALGNNVAESGSNNGSDCLFNCYGDAGGFIGTPITIKRSSMVATFAVAIVNGPSDRTLKENIEPLTSSLEKINALQGVSFNFIATPDKAEIGLIAQEVEPIVPEIVQTYDPGPGPDGSPRDPKLPPLLALDYPKLVAHLVEAIKTLTARVEALEAARS